MSHSKATIEKFIEEKKNIILNYKMGSVIQKVICCENLNVSCIKSPKQKTMNDIYEYSKKNDILIIPLVKNYVLDNLYPKEDEVEKWNIFIVGNDKTYILSKIIDKTFEIDDVSLLNNKASPLNMSERYYKFLEKIWEKTLNGIDLQFFCYIDTKLFFLNSFSLKNSNNVIIGGICVIRDAGIVDKSVFDNNFQPIVYKTNIK